MTKKSLTKY